MNGYIKKVKHTLILGLAILIIGILVYMVIPKYQIVSNNGNIYKINTITGEIKGITGSAKRTRF
jgi:hypothetical protein